MDHRVNLFSGDTKLFFFCICLLLFISISIIIKCLLCDYFPSVCLSKSLTVLALADNRHGDVVRSDSAMHQDCASQTAM